MTDFNPCACLGPINGEPHCPCAMKQLGLPRNPQPHQKSAQEALANAFKRSDEVAKTLEGDEFIQDGITYRETKHAGSWKVKSTVGLFVTANTKKIRSLKS